MVGDMDQKQEGDKKGISFIELFFLILFVGMIALYFILRK